MKWVFWDWAVIALVMWLRVPGLRYGRVKGGVYAVLFAVFDALVFGTLGVSLHSWRSQRYTHTIIIRYGLASPTYCYSSEKVRPSLTPHLSLSDPASSDHQHSRTGHHAREQGGQAVEGD